MLSSALHAAGADISSIVKCGGSIEYTGTSATGEEPFLTSLIENIEDVSLKVVGIRKYSFYIPRTLR